MNEIYKVILVVLMIVFFILILIAKQLRKKAQSDLEPVSHEQILQQVSTLLNCQDDWGMIVPNLQDRMNELASRRNLQSPPSSKGVASRWVYFDGEWKEFKQEID